MRRALDQNDWQSGETGWRLGRYELVFLGPKQWALEVDGVARSVHPRATEAATAAQLVDASRRRMGRLVRNGVVVLIGAVVFVVAQVGRFVPNPAYSAAGEYVLALEAAFQDVSSGRTSIQEFTGDDRIIGGEFTAPPPINLGGDTEPPERDYAVLLASYEGECYVIRWSPGAVRQYDILTAVYTPGLPCEVGPRLLQPDLFVRSWFQSIDGGPFEWEKVLPPPTFQVSWFIPVVIAALLLILQGVIGISLAVITPGRSTIPPLVVGGGQPRDP